MNLKKLFIGAMLLLLSSCAIQVPPDGGAKDVKPPKLLHSTPENYSTHFTGTSVELQFDEFIQVKDPSTQLVVSPLLKNQPVIKVKKKSVFIELSDTLMANTTYTMNFGNSIVDVNEGNIKENFQFVFSTGDHIDSLKITGSVKNAWNLKTDKNYVVNLYHESGDSLPYLERPDYFAKTDKEGHFTISNIAPGKYKIVAIKDTDGDYKYSGSTEAIGFSDSLVTSGTDSVSILLFNENPELKIAKSYSEYPGKAVIIFSQPVPKPEWQWITDTTKLKIYKLDISEGHDTIAIHYLNTSADSLSIIFGAPLKNDTITMRLFKHTEENKSKNKFEFTQTTATTGDLAYFSPFIINTNHPIATLDSSKITMLEDSVVKPASYLFADKLPRSISVDFKWKQKTTYKLKLLPGALKDIYGLNNDTSLYSFRIKSEADFGTLHIKMDSLQNGASYVLQLIDDNDIVYRSTVLTKSGSLNFINLDPRSYRLKLIVDKNNTGKWDTGNYLLHQQPEQILYYPDPITVRANWDVDVTWNKK